MSLIDGIGLPLATLLILKHFFQIFLHGLGQLIICIERCIAATVNLRILIVYIHATTARKISITNDKTLER